MPLRNARGLLPIALIAIAIGVVALLLVLRRPPPERELPSSAPLVRVLRAEPGPYRFRVEAFGSVSPRSESDLVPQVSGEVVWTSPALVSGGFFEKDEPLARIDRADYEAELQAARAAVARAESEFRRARKELDRQRRLADRSVASQARIDDAENAFRVAEATLQEAKSRLARARRDLERTELRAPYDGRVRSEQVDVGQFVSRGQAIARLYAIDYAEVRLPLPDRELAYLDLPLGVFAGRSEAAAEDEPRVHLEAEFAGQRYGWEGRLVRTEGEIDARTRMVHVVARVEDPYGRKDPERRGQPPLAVGLFVRARIDGREVEHALRLPREALREGHLVYVVDAESRLRFRPVEVLRAEREAVVLGSGIAPGERVCISPLAAAVDGMEVRIEGAPVAAASAADAAGGAPQ